VQIAAIVMTAIMIYHIKSKYTAVGRKEMVMFFYAYIACTLVEFLLMSNFISSGSNVYKVGIF
jgi:Ca2+/Na+ antiporter